MASVRRLGKILLWVLGTLVALMVVAVIGVYALLNSSFLLEQAQGRASKATGRSITIGALDVDWGWTPTVYLRKVDLANADWGKAERMFTADTVAFAIRIWPLLGGHVVLPFIRVENPTVALEKNKDGGSNWDFNENPVAATAVEAVRPDDRAEAPFIGQLEITKGKISYTDATRKLKLDGDIEPRRGRGFRRRSDRRVQGRRHARGSADQAEVRGRRHRHAARHQQALPARPRVDYGRDLHHRKGHGRRSLHLRRCEREDASQGARISPTSFRCSASRQPSTPPYDLAGDLKRTEKEWRLENMKGRIGNSEVTGIVVVEPRKKRNYLEAKLNSNNLDFDDLGPLIGIPPESNESASKEQKKEATEMKAEGNLFPTSRCRPRSCALWTWT
jgi:uncharacterized protein involved in outer membrane biogenesis